MGIPVFFKTLVEDYHDLLLPMNHQRVNHNLFLDLNCLIHPCCNEVAKFDPKEDLMISNIIHKINELILLVNPQKTIFIAIDGPAPKAKMIQQRTRRFKSSFEEKPWDTNAITPGTKFMNTLNSELKSYYENDKRILLSDSTEPGEGEHKILQFMKKHSKQDNNVVYGLDADLIMLSLVSKVDKILLLRERTEYNFEEIDDEYLFLDIDSLKKNITHLVKDVPKNIMINDYIFMCFLLGNDFIKNSPSLNLRYNGLDYLLETYRELQEKYHCGFYLIDESQPTIIHMFWFQEFIKELSNKETERLKRIHLIRCKQHKKYYAMYKSESSDKGDIMKHKPILFMDQEKEVFSDFDNWIYKYNLYTITNSFSINNAFVHLIQESVDKICENYLESLVWTAHYYFKECFAWDWCYHFEHAPTLHDFYQYLLKDNFYFKPYSQPYSAVEQLKMVLPYKSLYLLEEIGEKIPDDKLFLYPKEVKREYSFMKRYDWECHPILIPIL